MMNIQLKPGRYLVAVSGGVDSMVLLHMLVSKMHAQPRESWDLVVAHFDHGIRQDSMNDRKLVQSVSKEHGLPFVFARVDLGPHASEATARSYRYAFLRKEMQRTGTEAIITAHHLDDAMETAIINLLRGTGRRGLTAINGHADIIRPLLGTPKHELIIYAQKQKLFWREDSTNLDQQYLRNHIRHLLHERLDIQSYTQLTKIIHNMYKINCELDDLLDNQLQYQSVSGMIDRQWFTMLPHNVALETIASWLRSHGERHFDSKNLEYMVVAAKVAKPGKVFSLSRDHVLRVGFDRLALVIVER